VYQSGVPVVQERPRFVIRKEGQPMAEMGYVLSSEEMSNLHAVASQFQLRWSHSCEAPLHCRPG
jgi:hypothetical protein